MLILSVLNTHYGQAHILRDVSFELKRGECVALLGRNGAGKTTTLKTVMGLVTPTSGVVSYNGGDLKGVSSYKRARLGLGYVPEDRRVFGHLSVMENLVAAKQKSRKGRNPWTIERVFRLFPALVPLKEKASRFLSGGEQQMLTLARTLMTNPECLLLDEPTEGLAPIIVENVISAIEELKSDGLSILLSEQNRTTAQRLTKRALVLEKGTLLYDGDISFLSLKAREALGDV